MENRGVQALIPGALTQDELRDERRRVCREIGLTQMEREGRSMLVGRRRVKAWRVPGEPEYLEHARLVALCAEIFSGELVRTD
jgi:hypothetical protein